LSLSALDFDISGRIPLVLNRHYRATNLWLGDLGYGWSHPYGIHLWRDGDSFWFRGADGRRIPFEPPEVGKPFLQPTEKASLHRFPAGELPWSHLRQALPSGAFAVQIAADFTLLFDVRPLGRVYPLRGIADRHQNLSWVVPDAQGFPKRLTDPYGRVLTFLRNSAGLLIELQLFESEGSTNRISLVGYQYDMSNNLTIVQDPAGTRRYEYVDHVLKAYWDRRGGKFEIQYDREGRCIRTSEPENTRVRNYQFDAENKNTTVTDGLGNSSVYSFSDDQVVVQTQDEMGGKSKFEYDDKGRRVLAIDQEGNETAIAYGDQGLPVAKVSPKGSVTGLAFDSQGNLIERTSPCGAVTQYQRDAFGRVIKIARSGLGEQLIGRGADGSITSMELASGRTVSLEWSADGRRLTESDDEGLLTEQEFDLLGNRVLIRDALGAVTRYRYDKTGYLAEIVYPDSSRRLYRYDPEGRILVFTDEAGAVTSWTYDLAGRCTSLKFPNNEVVRSEYDSEKRMVAIQHPDGLRHRYQYDPRGLVTKQIFADGRMEEYRYDARGLLMEFQDAAGGLIEVARDPDGHLARADYPDGIKKIIGHDESGRWIRIETRDHVLERELTSEGLSVRESQDDYVVQREYGDTGELVFEVDSFGRQVTYAYDPDGRVTEVQVAAGTWQDEEWTPLSEPRIHRFGYDRIGNMTTWETPSGKLERRVYDSRRRLTEQTLQLGERVILSRKYSHDPAGRVIGIQDSERGARSYSYDVMGRIERVRHNGLTRTFSYDRSGNLISDGWEYLAGNRVSRIPGLALEYDHRGYIVGRTAPSGTDSFVNYSNGLIKEAKLADGRSLRFEYDPHARLVRKTDDVEEQGYHWKEDQLSTLSKDGTPKHDFLYLPGAIAPFEQSTRNNHYSIHTDANGRVLELVDDEGNIAWSDPAGVWGERNEIESSADGISCPFGFPGQVWEPRLGLYYNRHRFYCPQTAHYFTPDPIGIWGGLDAYRYVADPINLIDPDGLKCRGKNDDDILYRGDKRPPETICKEGFQARNPGAGLSLYQHVEGVPASGSNWISTTHDLDTAEGFGDTVYVISNPGCGEEVDCDPELMDKYGPDPSDSEHEIAFNKPIPPGKIVGFFKPDEGGMASFQACP